MKATIDDVPDGIKKLFVHYAFVLREKGFDRHSADAILHRIRWYEQIERGNRQFKCNNNITSVLSRWAMETYPQLAGMFETRASPGTVRGGCNE